MRAFMIISALVVLVQGRPEPPSGYQYPSPGPSSQQSQSNSYSAPLASVGSVAGSRSAVSVATSSSSQGSFSSAAASASFAGGFSGAGGSARSFGGHGGYSSRHNGYDQSGGILVHKHVYVHVPPPDHDEEHRPKAPVHVPAPQKHYKIIFIKAPTAPTPTAPIIPPLSQNEEKTIVYVLVKKPEEQPEIVIPTAAPTEPSRPEVYFIRYKAQKEDSHSNGHDVAGHDDFSDTVEVGARQGGGPSQNSASQSAAFSSSSSSSSSASSSSASARINGNGSGNSVSSLYGAPRSSGPY